MAVVRRLLAVLVTTAAVTSVWSSPLTASAAPGDAGLADSAVTVSGTGEFANLRVTVSQTRNLINQVVTVSWTGGKPTRPLSSQFAIDYLQIMQCWGDDSKGPDRTQCQYGAVNTNKPLAGSWVRSRQVTYTFVDPKETLQLPADSVDIASVPFWAVGRDRPTGPATNRRSDFFDGLSTNEIPVARTNGDGSGLEFFEVQTVRQAPGLGCGDPVVTGGTVTGRPCWLVIVPRGSTEVDGSILPSDGNRQLQSSPLSQSNWDNRIAVRLEFLPVGQACPLGPPERPVVGHELMTDAVSSWQPALCAGGGSLFSYAQLPDDQARSQLLGGGSAGLTLVTDPIPPSQPPPEHSLVYAPVGLSGLAVAFNIDHQAAPLASPAEKELDGRRFGAMKLTPRLVAKLLTQSYRLAVLGAPPPEPNPFGALQNNPVGLSVDPEFLALNPEYQDFGPGPPDALVQLTNSDLTAMLWTWVDADPDARAFLAGTPDPFGMVVNPANQGLSLPTTAFPRSDQSCYGYTIGPGHTLRECTSDHHPYALDMHDAGRATSRGDAKEQGHMIGSDRLVRLPPQNPGQRAVMAVVDAATAARYGLPVAALRNTAGQFVTPTTSSLLAGVAAMKPSAVAGVLSPDPTTGDPAAYPLTALSYAVTVPDTLDTAARADYAAFLRYAAGPGQQPGVAPGQLPRGMVPLPDALRAQTTAVAAAIQAPVPSSPAPSPNPGNISSVRAPASPGPSSTTRTDAPRPRGETSPAGGASTPKPSNPVHPTSASPRTSQNGAQRPIAGLGRTPPLSSAAWVGIVLLVVLICGVVAALSTPVIPLLGAFLARRARKEVTPTEL